jgi:hypothetical protein
MAGLVGLIKAKPLKPVLSATSNNPYAMAMQIPAESDRIFDGDLKLLLMDGLSEIPPPSFSSSLVKPSFYSNEIESKC